ncbi:MAG: ABC transporter permease, partial [Bacteroidetes bacterium]|nr:ABC transporter permease [Bacteroidota bacterium]
MIFNYFLLSFRNLVRQRGYAVVNLFGLALGLAAALFILLYVKDELTFDTMHPYAANTYRMGYKVQFPNGNSEAAPYAPAGWDNFIQSNYTGIKGITSYASWGMPTSIGYAPKDRIILTEDIIWAESTITDIVYCPIIKGAATNPLKEINSMILTESSAKELFGNEDPINKTVTVSHQATNGQNVEMIVTAVMK